MASLGSQSRGTVEAKQIVKGKYMASGEGDIQKESYRQMGSDLVLPVATAG